MTHRAELVRNELGSCDRMALILVIVTPFLMRQSPGSRPGGGDPASLERRGPFLGHSP
jgi:hypothetical protein